MQGRVGIGVPYKEEPELMQLQVGHAGKVEWAHPCWWACGEGVLGRVKLNTGYAWRRRGAGTGGTSSSEQNEAGLS
jgi:hypothetical protein